jgi:excinuclease ABC subunit A
MLPIVLRGARTHNLKSLDLELAPGELVALTGPSGAGKSSLAMDTLYAEGQRRFVESFSPYARQFLERLPRPPIDRLDPVAATVAVDRRAPVKSSRSTLATMADLEPYLAGLFARESRPVCPECGELAVPTTASDAAARILSRYANGGGARARVSYPLRAADAEAFLELRETLARDGYRRLVVGGTMRDLDEVRPSEATAPDVRLEVVVDRVALRASDARRLQHALETAWERGDGRAELLVETSSRTGQQALPLDDETATAAKRVALARGLSCPACSRVFDPPRPGLFSYNSPVGACGACRGFGRTIEIDWDKVIPDRSRSIRKGAIKAWAGSSAEWERESLLGFAKKKKIPVDVPWDALTPAQHALVLEGEGSWEGGKYPGVRAWFKWLESRTYKMHVRVLLARYRDYVVCTACKGARLGAASLAYQVGGMALGEWHACTVTRARAALEEVVPRDAQGKRLREELLARLRYLEDVGLGYLTLDRQARTLSGGEAQRAGLTNALGASLTGALFVLDEPTVGLHALDVPALGRAIRKLAGAGNGVVVIEHDRSVVAGCDRVIELGPGAGAAGGRILFDGTPAALAQRLDLPTGAGWAAASGPPRERRQARGVLRVRGARALTRATLVDQAPLGRTARGNPATYTKAWDRLRARFASEPAAGARGLGPSHFSFNVGGDASGRCETCAGEGYETGEMQFLADVYNLCPVCQGKRFRPEVLAVQHRGVSVAEALELSIEEALARFDGDGPRADRDPVLRRALEPLVRVGLGYLPLGQPLSTLSGGEAQRLKLARALASGAKGTLFVVDEPSAGLHASDAAFVVRALHGLADEGASVLVVEHDLDVVRTADWIIDLGPGGGPDGGSIAAEGTPERVAASGSKTGIALSSTEFGAARPPSSAVATERWAPAIRVDHAREHILQSISCSIPHGSLCVVTGPSGSGKSSLAFDVVFAEGQRRFMETLTPYARQFLPTLPRPDVDGVVGVPPSIALEQRLARAGGNSTVATVTEVAHYLRLLYAKVGEVHCPACDAVVDSLSPDELFEALTSRADASIHTVYAPAVRARKGTYLDLFTAASRASVQSARVDGAIVSIEPPPRLTKAKEHTIDLIVHYGPLASLDRPTFERALAWGAGALRVARGAPSAKTRPDEKLWSTARSCVACGAGVPELDPRWFSFNTKQGQCERCEGRGTADPERTLGDPGAKPCKACGGTRLAPVPRRVRLFDESYPAFLGRDVKGALRAARAWRWSGRAASIAPQAHKELLRRLAFIDGVGLGYLALDRAAFTLSGGEMQRLRLSAQLGSGLTGALYVLDEPTIGLHPRDTQGLLQNLRALTEAGSTVLVVEHDAETIAAADHVIDLGPSGGRGGGHVMAAGPAREVLVDPRSPTAEALRSTTRVQRASRPMADRFLELRGARAHNLKDVTLRVPVGRLTVVAGVSGSGKSTLVRRVFYPALRHALGLVAEDALPCDGLRGAQAVKRALAVDQSPIGRTPRSVPATFLGVWDDIRRLFAGLPESKTRGYTPARFSFNTGHGGRCPECAGQGSIVSEMAFLPDVVSPCASCGGARFEPATLDVRYAGLSIGDVLHLSAEDAAKVFKSHRRIARPLETLADLGVGYVQLGQGSNTLSGGEAQRLKLAAELTAGAMHEPTVYVLDEPTTGLHLSDVGRLVAVLHRLVERGDTLVVIEHHPDVIASADWVIELGPEGGSAGGRVVFEGEPRVLAKAKTPTGRFFARDRSAAARPDKRSAGASRTSAL